MAERGALRRIPRFAASRSLWALNAALDRVETVSGGPADAPLPEPPVFIVGPPRTGSTLLYQLVVGCFHVGYLSNRHCRLYGAPSLVERIRHPEPPSVLESRYGRDKLRRLRASVRALGNAAGRPLVFKNLICALRLGPISETLPEAVFVRIRRNVLATAVSLLAGRNLTPRRPPPSTLEQAEPQPIDDDLQDQLAAYIRDR